MPNLRLAAINHIDSATLTDSPAGDPNQLPFNLTLNNRDRVYRSTSLATQQIKATWSANRKANFCSMHKHNLHGSNWRVQLYSDAAWTTQVYDSGTVATYTALPYGSSFQFGIDPADATNTDLYRGEAAAVVYFTAVSFRSAKVTLSGSTTDTAVSYWELKRIWLGMYLETTYQVTTDLALAYQSQGANVRMGGGSLRSLPSVPWRKLDMNLDWIPEAQRVVLLDMMHWAGTSGDWFVSVYPEDGTRLERDYTMMAKLAALPTQKYAHLGLTAQPFSFVET